MRHWPERAGELVGGLEQQPFRVPVLERAGQVSGAVEYPPGLEHGRDGGQPAVAVTHLHQHLGVLAHHVAA